MELISFNFLNQFRDFVCLDALDVINEYLSCTETISKNFHYPHCHNGLILNTLIFNTSNWSNEELNTLKEPLRIKSIFEWATEVFYHGCDLICDDIGVKNLGQLIVTLETMTMLNKNGSLSPESPLELSTLIEETEWLHFALKSFEDICSRVSPDSDYVNKTIAMKNGSFSFEEWPQWYIINTNIWTKRYLNFTQNIMENSSSLPLSRGFKYHIAFENFRSAIILEMVMCNFGHSTFKDQLKYMMGPQNNLSSFEDTIMHSQPMNFEFLLKKTDLSNGEKLKNYLEKGTCLRRFFQDQEVVTLVRLAIIFGNTTSKEMESLHLSALRLLSNKLKKFGFCDTDLAIRTLFENLSGFRGLLMNFVQAITKEAEISYS